MALKDDGVVMLLVARRKQKRDAAAPHQTAKLVQRGGAFQLFDVFLLERLPFCRIVIEPAPQRRARCDLLHPDVDTGLVFAESAWP